MPKKSSPQVEIEVIEFPIVTAETLRKHIELSRHDLVKYREELDKDIYWFQRLKGGTVFYNQKLWQHYIQCGKGWEHSLLIEQYLKTIPKPK